VQLPAKDTLERLKLLFEVFLLVLVLPLVVLHVFTHPHHSAEKAIGGAMQ
jgi:hypothetical protein